MSEKTVPGGPGEGLKGLVRKLLNECKAVLSLAEAEIAEAAGVTNLNCLKRRMAELEAALEAAARLPIPPPFNKEEIDVLVQGFSGDTGWLTAQLNKLMEVKRADRALATPSPQAPEPMCECTRGLDGTLLTMNCERHKRLIVPAATREPAGSGATVIVGGIRDRLQIFLERLRIPNCPVSSTVSDDFVKGWDAAKAHCAERIESILRNYSDPGAPRKVGEDGAQPGVGSGALREALAELNSISDLLHEHAVGLRYTNALRGISIGDLASRLDSTQVKLEAALSLSSPIEPVTQCDKQTHMYVWTVSPRWVAVAQAKTVAEAREALLEEIGSSGDGSCPEREAADKFVREHSPNIWHGRNAEFALTDSAELREQVAYVETLQKKIEALALATPQPSSEIREALEKLEIHKFGAAADSWKDVEETEYFQVSDVLALLAPSRQGAGGK